MFIRLMSTLAMLARAQMLARAHAYVDLRFRMTATLITPGNNHVIAASRYGEVVANPFTTLIARRWPRRVRGEWKTARR